jgi:CopZ-like zinc binding protein
VVDRVTLKALLRPPALMRLQAPKHHFCPTSDCPVVYFGRDDVFRRDDILVPVFQKEPEGDRTVCYCFAVTEGEIRCELQATGHSTASERITVLVQAGRCACEVRNPQGSCCLGNVASVTTEAMVRARPPEALHRH